MKRLAALFAALLLLPAHASAATIYTTNSSDTQNTIRTNVNSSLTNLNNYSTTTGSCSGSVSCASFVLFGSSPLTITGSGLTSYNAWTQTGGYSATSSKLYPQGLQTGTSTIGVLNATSSVTVGTLGGFVGGNAGALYAFATSTIKTSQLTNDSGFLASYDAFTHALTGYSATSSVIYAPLQSGSSTIGALVATTSLKVASLSGVLKGSSGTVGTATYGTDFGLSR